MKLHRASLLVLSLCIVSSSAFAVNNGRSNGPGAVVLRANVPMGTVLGTGDRISFGYQTRADAAVLVFNIDAEGFVHLLAPAGAPEVSRATETYPVPPEEGDLVIDAATGVEFVFALAVRDPSTIDGAELERMRRVDSGEAEPMRIDGDPFVAANMIAAQLVPGVSRVGATFGYTYFYVNERVEYPCYLCGACDGVADDPACTDYRVVQAFDRRDTLAYPLQRGYETVTAEADVYAEEGTSVEVPEGSDVDVNFYPYGVEARAVDPFYTSLWNDYWWYDPFYWYGPYYPYYGPGWGISIGFGWGWGWGWWGGYYCSGWYAPCHWGYDGYYPSGPYTPPAKFKDVDKGGSSLTSNRAVAAKYDGDLRIASKDVQKSLSRPVDSSMRSKSGVTRGSYPGSSRGKGAIDAVPRVKTTVGGRSSHGVKSAPRGATTSPRVKSSSRTAPSRRGVADVPRGGGGHKSRAVKPTTRGSSRGSAGMSSQSSGARAKGGSAYRAPSSRGSGGAGRATAPRSSGAARGGGRSKGR